MTRLLISLLFCIPALAQASYAGRPEVQDFVRELAKRHGLVESELKRVFAKAQRLDRAPRSACALGRNTARC